MSEVKSGWGYERYSCSPLMAEKLTTGQSCDVGSIYGAVAVTNLFSHDNTVREIPRYQTINITSSELSIAEATRNHLMTGLITLTSFYGVKYITAPHLEIKSNSEKIQQRDELAEGYRAMAEENCFLAEGSISIAREVWPDWEE